MSEKRDSIDFGKEPIGKLFRQIFVPTLLGLFFSAILNIADGIFVGRGVGSDALAAINIAAPVFMIASGISLLFGAGVSVVAAIHLGKGNVKAARINVTQSFSTALVVMSIVVALVCIFPKATCSLFGGSDLLYPYVKTYLRGVALGQVLGTIALIGMFVLRLDGSPKIASAIQIVYSILNIILDYIFVFPLHLGIAGAAWATSISQCVGALTVIVYMVFFCNTLSLYKPKFTKTALGLYFRNIWYMVKVGFSNFLGEIAMTCVMIAGNYRFMGMLGEDGVAAFSVACYLFPVIFMVGQAIAQSAQPIISFNYGRQDWDRVGRTRRLAFAFAGVSGLLVTCLGVIGTPAIAGLFLGPCHAKDIACDGLPLFSLAFAFFTYNIVVIGYYQSIEKVKKAILFMILRGFVFVIPAFIIMPILFGEKGLWLSVFASEALTLTTILVSKIFSRK